MRVEAGIDVAYVAALVNALRLEPADSREPRSIALQSVSGHFQNICTPPTPSLRVYQTPRDHSFRTP